MALSQVGTGAHYDNDGGSWTTSGTALAKDTGTAIDDLIVILVSWYENGSDTALTTPTGFTSQGGFVVGGTGTGESRLNLYTRVVDGTEGGSFAVARATNIFGTAMLFTLRGVSALSVASVTAGTAANGTSIAAPSVTGSSTQGLVAAYGLSDPGGTYTPPGGMTLGVAPDTDLANTGRAYYESLSANGATGTRTLSWTNTRDAIGLSMLVDGASASAGATAAPAQATETVVGQIPALLKERTVAPGVGLATVGGLSPSALGENQIGPTTGAVQTLGLAPVLSTERVLAPDAGALSLAGLAPTLLTEQNVQPDVGSVLIQGLIPSLDTGEDASAHRGHVGTGRRWHGRANKYEGSETPSVALAEVFPEQAALPIQPPLGGLPTFKPLDSFPVGVERPPYVVPPELLAESRARIAKKRRRRDEELIMLTLL